MIGDGGWENRADPTTKVIFEGQSEYVDGLKSVSKRTICYFAIKT
jgi:hypothetical protein